MAGSIRDRGFLCLTCLINKKSIISYALILGSLASSCATQESSEPKKMEGALESSQIPASSSLGTAPKSPLPQHKPRSLPLESSTVRPTEKSDQRSIDEIINSVKSLDDDPSLKNDASLSKELDSGRIPLEMNDAVQKWIGYFTTRDRDRFQRFLNRGETYRPMIMAVLRDLDIPPEIYFQAMIESGFYVHAKSHAQAVGIWQFIKPTAKRYGLRINSTLDERRDPIRATIAASLYLRDLYNVFQSWYLAMAAYNAGEGRILNAIMKAKTRDFWEMARRRQLPAETMDYIPKFLAAAIIGHSPEKYGFEVPHTPPSLKLASIQAPGGRSLPVLAKALEVPLQDLKEHNPHLLRQITPHDTQTYRLWLPAAFSAKSVSDQLATLPPSEVTSFEQEEQVPSQRSQYSPPQITEHTVHRVRRGETLAKIAQLYQVPIADLKAVNKMTSHKIMVGQRLLIGSSGLVMDPKNKLVRYTVRPGDNLAQLAQKFGVSITEIKKMNRLRHHKIYAGQVLKVAPKG